MTIILNWRNVPLRKIHPKPWKKLSHYSDVEGKEEKFSSVSPMCACVFLTLCSHCCEKHEKYISSVVKELQPDSDAFILVFVNVLCGKVYPLIRSTTEEAVKKHLKSEKFGKVLRSENA